MWVRDGYSNMFQNYLCLSNLLANAKWIDITNLWRLITCQKPDDRPNIVSRAFKIKLFDYISTKEEHFGTIKAGIISRTLIEPQ